VLKDDICKELFMEDSLIKTRKYLLKCRYNIILTEEKYSAYYKKV